jgi:nicotinamidase/pyrazinamidase
MHALLLIDIQNDFLTGGTLAVPDGDRIIDVANLAIESAEHVVATQDWHPHNHGSFASQHEGVAVGQRFVMEGLPQIAWPDHCIAGTPGAKFPPQLRTEKINHFVRKGTDRTIDSYSAFFDNDHRQSTGLDDYLKSRSVDELTVMGLTTDYCVKFTVFDALQLGYQTRVMLAGCRGVNLNAGDVDAAIDEMREIGAAIIAPES